MPPVARLGRRCRLLLGSLELARNFLLDLQGQAIPAAATSPLRCKQSLALQAVLGAASSPGRCKQSLALQAVLGAASSPWRCKQSSALQPVLGAASSAKVHLPAQGSSSHVSPLKVSSRLPRAQGCPGLLSDSSITSLKLKAAQGCSLSDSDQLENSHAISLPLFKC